MGSRHQNFATYRRAARLADDIHGAVVHWQSFERWTVGIQLVRAADSIGANIAEALGRGTLRDQRRLLIIARGSLLEAEHWADRAVARGLMHESEIHPRVAELGRMLNGLIRTDPARA